MRYKCHQYAEYGFENRYLIGGVAMTTPYKVLFDGVITKLRSTGSPNISEDEFDAILLDYIRPACVKFRACKQDLNRRKVLLFAPICDCLWGKSITRLWKPYHIMSLQSTINKFRRMDKAKPFRECSDCSLRLLFFRHGVHHVRCEFEYMSKVDCISSFICNSFTPVCERFGYHKHGRAFSFLSLAELPV